MERVSYENFSYNFYKTNLFSDAVNIFQDEDDPITDFRSRFGEKLLIAQGVNITALDKEDLRCGGLVMFHNMTKLSQQRLEVLSADCMVQKCDFR